ncbi:assimilatory nitrite reductase large subunit [Hydrogenovibrio sp. SC-1]|uniref:NAD(P)/FAD-dependent oxidoreductase n=1 Tax=Hydrogenovibrio sp. SC-1 TaxID=2065820 RepID=UPI000C7D7750|nr:FAD-dependent oxidoreductase [Hydrogenovibrio sp. SC-1]PLA74962.1 assimilatory nitrite reductase large subunit [Hydrogenovibrio sp. SC-1]
MKPKLILVGTGMAGTRFLEHLLEEAPDTYEIEVFNKEPVGGYNRIMLSPVLAGEKTIPDIMTHDEAWFEEQRIRLHTGKTVSAIDSVGQVLTTFCGETYFYDKLVIATGSNPFKLEIPGADLPGVVTFRDIRDVENMLSVSENKNKAIVIGGGLLGLEAAHGLIKRGMDVTVIHRNEVLMNVQMDKESSQLLKNHLEQDSNHSPGMKFRLGVNTTEILGQQQVEGIRLDDGAEIATDLVVMSIGIRPNIQLAKQANLDVNRGILVNDYLETSAENIYALGECNEHRGQTYGLVAPLYEQAKVLAKRLAGQYVSYKGSITSTMLKVTGVNLFSAGDFKGENGTDVIVFRDLAKNIYRKIVLKNNQVIGALLFGDTTGATWLFELLQKKQNISSMRETLVFGPGY